mgnify:CR=1 FL=1
MVKKGAIGAVVIVVILSLVVSGIVYLVVTSRGQESGLATSPKDDSQTQLESIIQTPVESTAQPRLASDLTFLTLDTPASLDLVVDEPTLVIQGSIRQDALLT